VQDVEVSVAWSWSSTDYGRFVPGTKLPSNCRSLERTECRNGVTVRNKLKMIFADRKRLTTFIISADFLIVLNALFNVDFKRTRYSRS